MPALAFYKGMGTWVDRLIRLATRSQYSHVEFVLDDMSPDQNVRRCISASSRDGGVRGTDIDFNSGNWDLVPLVWLNDDYLKFLIAEKGKKYDYLGIVLSQMFALHRHNPNKWFCSELCAAAAGLEAPEGYSPGSLKLAIEKLNEVYAMGVAAQVNYSPANSI